jgi:hypothetical protein
VAGYRAWQLGPAGVLFPLALPAAPPWEPSVNRARCFAARCHNAHEAPGHRCKCGLHALRDPDDERLKLGHPAVGAVAAWGEIEVYAAGFRAEYASVIALADERSRSTGPPGSGRIFPEADDGTRTRYLELGKLALYLVSYVREEVSV